MELFSINFRQYKWLYFYYLVLHTICLSWTNTAMVAPNAILRLGITTAVFIPLIKYLWLAPAVIVLFVGLRFNSIAPFGYIPQGWFIYELAIIILATIHSIIYKKNDVFNFSKHQLYLLSLVFIVDLINIKICSSLFLFLLALCILYNALRDKISLNITMLSFVILTITLSVYYFLFAKEFMIAYSYGSDTERAAWVDPNYFGILLGCGIIISTLFLFSTTKVIFNFGYKVLFTTCIILGFITIVLQASRGAILAVSSAILLQIFFSKMKMISKIFIIILLTFGIIYLFNSGYFALLIERTLGDSTGSGRAEIWMNKFSGWSESLVNIFGCGYQSSVYDFPPYNDDCHNEFLSILINYGLIGLIITVLEILRLFLYKQNRAFIWSFMAFVGVGFMTLSPFTCQTGWTAIPFILVVLYKSIQLNSTL